jgi:hypothetical protein
MMVLPSDGTTTIDNIDDPALALGPHTVVMSGEVRLFAESHDDGWLDTDYITFDFGPLWYPNQPIRASTIVSWGAIYSHDSDEVNHSGWGIHVRETGHAIVPVGTYVAWQLRVKIVLHTQGAGNSWVKVAFQTVANGQLLYPEDTLRKLHVTKELANYIDPRRLIGPAE